MTDSMMREQFEQLSRLVQERRDDGLAVTLALTIRLHANGAMSVEGPTGDKEFCRKLLDEAWNAIKRQPERATALIIPGQDVDSRAKETYL